MEDSKTQNRLSFPFFASQKSELKSLTKKFVKMVADKKTRSSDKEEELLLQDFSRRVTAKSSALFYGNAFIVSAIPIWLYWRIHAVGMVL